MSRPSPLAPRPRLHCYNEASTVDTLLEAETCARARFCRGVYQSGRPRDGIPSQATPRLVTREMRWRCTREEKSRRCRDTTRSFGGQGEGRVSPRSFSSRYSLEFENSARERARASSRSRIPLAGEPLLPPTGHGLCKLALTLSVGFPTRIAPKVSILLASGVSPAANH